MTAAETWRPGVTCSRCHSLSCPTTAAGLFFALAASGASLAPAPGTWWTRGADRANAAIRPITSHAMPMPNGTRNPTLKTLSGHLPLTQRTDRNIWASWWISFSRGSKGRAWTDLRVWWSCHVEKSNCTGCWSWSDVELMSFLTIKKKKKKKKKQLIFVFFLRAESYFNSEAALSVFYLCIIMSKNPIYWLAPSNKMQNLLIRLWHFDKLAVLFHLFVVYLMKKVVLNLHI